jgi:hypothetical protein
MCLATATHNIYWVITTAAIPHGSSYWDMTPALDEATVCINAICSAICAVLARRIDFDRCIKKRLRMDVAVSLLLFCILGMRVASNLMDDNGSHSIAVFTAFLLVLFVWYPQVSVLAMLTYDCLALLNDIERLATLFEARIHPGDSLIHRHAKVNFSLEQGEHSSSLKQAHKKHLYVALSRRTLAINSAYYYPFPIALTAVVITLGVSLMTLFTGQCRSFLHVDSVVAFLNLVVLTVPALSVALVNRRIVAIKNTVSNSLATTRDEREEGELAILLLLMIQKPPMLRIFGVELDFARCAGSIVLYVLTYVARGVYNQQRHN